MGTIGNGFGNWRYLWKSKSSFGCLHGKILTNEQRCTRILTSVYAIDVIFVLKIWIIFSLIVFIANKFGLTSLLCRRKWKRTSIGERRFIIYGKFGWIETIFFLKTVPETLLKLSETSLKILGILIKFSKYRIVLHEIMWDWFVGFSQVQANESLTRMELQKVILVRPALEKFLGRREAFGLWGTTEDHRMERAWRLNHCWPKAEKCWHRIWLRSGSEPYQGGTFPEFPSQSHCGGMWRADKEKWQQHRAHSKRRQQGSRQVGQPWVDQDDPMVTLSTTPDEIRDLLA